MGVCREGRTCRHSRVTSLTREQKARPTPTLPATGPREDLRPGMGPAGHLGRLAGARGVSGPARRPDRARARRSQSKLVLGWVWHANRHLYRDLLVEGRASEMAVGAGYLAAVNAANGSAYCRHFPTKSLNPRSCGTQSICPSPKGA